MTNYDARDDGTGNDDQLGDEYDRNGQLHALPIVGRNGEPSFTLVSREEINAAHAAALEEEAEREETRAQSEWYTTALKAYRDERAYWQEQYDADPPSERDQMMAQDLLNEGYLDEIRLEHPVSPRETGEVGVYEAELVPPPAWLIQRDMERYNEAFRAARKETTSGIRLDVGRFNDTVRYLFYRAKLNYLFGKGGSGKTSLMMKVAAEFIMNREPVVWLIFEEITPAELDEMLVQQGVPEILVGRYFHAIKVQKGWDPYDDGEENPALVILDSVNPCMKLLGLNPNEADSMVEVVETYFDPYRDENPDMTGIVIDHVGLSEKAKDRPAGHHSKLDRFQGAAYRLAAMRGGSEGDWGYSVLYLAKNNKGKGGIRLGDKAGYLVMDSTDKDRKLNVRLVSEEPTGTSHTPAGEVASNKTANGAKDIAERILREHGRISDEDWRALIMDGLRAVNEGVEDPALRVRMRKAVSQLKNAGVADQDGDEWIHVPTVKPLD